MPAAKPSEKELTIVPYRIKDKERVYSNHVEVNTSQLDVNIKFCDARPPENQDDIEDVKKTGKVRIPIVSEIVIPLEVAKELARILNEAFKNKEEK